MRFEIKEPKTLADIMQPKFPSARVDIGPHHELECDNMLHEWGDAQYAPLSVIHVYLRFLAFVHQTHHWIAKGDMFYGDHKLFEQLYEKVVDEIDDVAEKAVGLNGEASVDLLQHTMQLMKLVQTYGCSSTIPSSSELAKRSLSAECKFVSILKIMCNTLKQQSTCTDGVENMLQQMADDHERHIYLLRRRCNVSM